MIHGDVGSQNEFKAKEFVSAVEDCLAHTVQSEVGLDLLFVYRVFLRSYLPIRDPIRPERGDLRK